MSDGAQEIVNFVCDNGVHNGMQPIGAAPTMPATVNTQPKPKSMHGDSADGQILAQVEKWMAMIREISREQAKN